MNHWMAEGHPHKIAHDFSKTNFSILKGWLIMKVLVIEAGHQPMVKEIDGSLRAMQEVVGGLYSSDLSMDGRSGAGLQRGREDQRHGLESSIVG